MRKRIGNRRGVVVIDDHEITAVRGAQIEQIDRAIAGQRKGVAGSIAGLDLVRAGRAHFHIDIGSISQIESPDSQGADARSGGDVPAALHVGRAGQFPSAAQRSAAADNHRAVAGADAVEQQLAAADADGRAVAKLIGDRHPQRAAAILFKDHAIGNAQVLDVHLVVAAHRQNARAGHVDVAHRAGLRSRARQRRHRNPSVAVEVDRAQVVHAAGD